MIVGCTSLPTSRSRLVKENWPPQRTVATTSENVDAIEMGSMSTTSFSLHRTWRSPLLHPVFLHQRRCCRHDVSVGQSDGLHVVVVHDQCRCIAQLFRGLQSLVDLCGSAVDRSLTVVVIAVHFMAQAHQLQAVLLYQRLLCTHIAPHVGLLDQILVRVQHHAQVATETDVQNVLQLHQARVLRQQHLAVLFLQDARHRRQLLVLRNKHGRTADRRQTQNGCM